MLPFGGKRGLYCYTPHLPALYYQEKNFQTMWTIPWDKKVKTMFWEGRVVFKVCQSRRFMERFRKPKWRREIKTQLMAKEVE